MWKLHQNKKGLTLLELLVTIGVLAIVAVIAFPLVGNIIPTAQNRAVEEAQKEVNDFVSRWNESGAYSFDEDTGTWIGYVDLNGNGVVDEGETVEQLDLNEDQYTIERTVGDSPLSAGAVDFSVTPADQFIIGGGQPGSGGIVALYDPVTITYLTTGFTIGSNYQNLSPTVADGSGDKTYSLVGSLPSGVSFDDKTGSFTGPSSTAWNFTASQISTGHLHSCALTTTRIVKCWGDNNYGQLGDGTTTDRTLPVDVSGLSNVIQLSSNGGNSTCAVLSDGTAKCWGLNLYGQLGDGTTTNRSTPVTVSGLTGVSQISAGNNNTCALLSNGTAKCWGWNQYGQLGDGTTTNRSTPVTVSGLTGVTQIQAGSWISCALLSNDTVKCWGNNQYGQLGDGTTTNRSTPVTVSGLTGVEEISASDYNACAVLGSGIAKCWGNNWTGTVGDGTTTNRSTPVTVSGLTGVAGISVMGNAACAVLDGGSAKCWGRNTQGNLGDGTTTTRLTPVTVSGLTSATQISTAGGDNHSCARLNDGSVKCWGDGSAGQLGNGETAPTGYCTNDMFTWEGQSRCERFGGTWIVADMPTDSLTPSSVQFGSGFGLQPGFPATVDVTVSDESGSDTITITLSAN